ncbi:cytochrome P450 [Actinoallomurus purpureus]|uniref:cytochrome P450 n=1 Tax=Actinoallomurus purpureus TaxID=478114 RepID=UPI0020925605|nr:cytochrome P450 [Actinoallomurus purpureus]MCO6005194.1 cytochrome P450 [Actinoallomurus purpureus]
MMTTVVAVVAAALVLSLPYWLPGRIVALRVWIFARVNGDEGITVPGPLVDVSRFKQVYADPAADGRSRGAALSDLFWYWLAPGPEIHQEHLEPGPMYEEVARTTRAFLAMPTARAEELTSLCVERGLRAIDRATTVRLRDLMMPIWAEFYYEVVFGERCPPEARELIVANADDVVTALKCCGLRHMDRRHRLTDYLERRLPDVRHPLPEGMPARERALYLQGTFFNTAIVQTSEAMTHLLMVLAHRRDVQERLRDADDRYAQRVVDETLRLYPLFGVAHRVTSGEIRVGEDTTIPAGSVLCFAYPDFHRAGFDDADAFRPERWETLSVRDVNHIPFGVAANRPCPAWHLTPITMRVAAREVVRCFTLRTSAAHTRSVPNRGPCLLIPRGETSTGVRRAAPLAVMRVRDRWEDVWRSLVQLVLGGYMVWDARRQRLCERHFAHIEAASACPVTGRSQ